LPHLLYAWLHRGPIISLLVAGAFFAVGLVVFVYSSRQDSITSIITTCFATLQTLGILSLTILFIRDRWKFRRERGITGQKLTKFSILFGIIEGMERLFKYVFLPSSNSSLEKANEHSQPSTYSGFSTTKVSQIQYDPNFWGQPSPLFFHARTTSDYQVQPFNPIGLPARVGPTGLESNVQVHRLSPVQEHPSSGRDRKDSSKRVRIRESDDFLRLPGMPNQQTTSYLVHPPPVPSASVQEMRHFAPGNYNANRFNNNINQASRPAHPVAPLLPPPPEEWRTEPRQRLRPSSSWMEMKHFGKHAPDSRNAALAAPESGRTGASPTWRPLPPGHSVSVQEMKHFNTRKLNKSDGGGRDGNSSSGSKRW